MVEDKIEAAKAAAEVFAKNHGSHDQKTHGRKGISSGAKALGSFSKLMDWAEGKGLQIGTKKASGLSKAGFKDGENIIEIRDKKTQALLSIYKDSPAQHKQIMRHFGA